MFDIGSIAGDGQTENLFLYSNDEAWHSVSLFVQSNWSKSERKVC